MLHFYHGTSWSALENILDCGIISEYGRGEFGQGFYTHHHANDNSLAQKSAISWAERNGDIGVLEIIVCNSDYAELIDTNASLDLEFASKSRDLKDYNVEQRRWINFICAYGRLPYPYFRSDKKDWILPHRAQAGDVAPNAGYNLVIGPFFGPTEGSAGDKPRLSDFDPILPYERPDGRHPIQVLWCNKGVDLINDLKKTCWNVYKYTCNGELIGYNIDE